MESMLLTGRPTCRRFALDAFGKRGEDVEEESQGGASGPAADGAGVASTDDDVDPGVELGRACAGLDAWKPWTTLGRLVGFPPRLSARIQAHRHGSNVGTTAAA
ncbi:hypothetical protein V1477_006767 [Vespula maculifrons]|uniref:Uncharacterized protein n=1 Tax=Vespula maculifrons TaxID=7453 RepID=A0ABD2CGQ4_VESMC